MFNIGKTLLFIVAMITSAAFLFFVPHFHMPHKLASLITTHRIKSFLTLLSPIIFGAITAYIAYQQHCLAKTQANISRDQRDIAHNKQRIENHNLLYELTKPIQEAYNLTNKIPCSFPNSLRNNNRIIELSIEISDEDSNFSNNEREFSQYIFKNKRHFDDKISECFISMSKLKYMIDEKTFLKIDMFLKKSQGLFYDRWNNLQYSAYNIQSAEESREKIEQINTSMGEFRVAYSRMNSALTKYMYISDILEPRKFN